MDQPEAKAVIMLRSETIQGHCMQALDYVNRALEKMPLKDQDKVAARLDLIHAQTRLEFALQDADRLRKVASDV